MTVTEARDMARAERIANKADRLRDAADRLIEEWFDEHTTNRQVLALRQAVYDYDDAMSAPEAEAEDDLVAADIYSQLMNDSITATGYEESQVCGACSGTGESKQGGSTCYRCKGEGVCSTFTE
jgi:hypothetical protein